MQSMWVGWRVALLLVLSSACSPPVNFAGLKMGERHTELRERMLLRTLDNGLRVVVVPDYRSNMISIGVNYDVGAADDPEGGAGLAHYVEHVMFYSAFRGPDGPALNEVGLYKNAWTVLDRTYFTLSALSVELDPALELTARRFEATCDDLDTATLERERDVVIEEAKLRASRSEMANALEFAVWGPSHVYGHDAGGTGFASVPHDALCKFVADHYGPKSAVLVVTGNVSDADFERIRRRFERIPTRDAVRSAAPAVATSAPTTARFVLNDVAHPTALLVFSAPGQGGTADAALDALDGRSWPLERGAPTRYATTVVVGEQRKRAIVAIAEVEDAKQLDELSAAMRRSFEHVHIQDSELELYKEQRRSALAAQLDDPFASAETIAVEVARGERPTRFRDLRQLDPLAAADLTRWFDTSNAHAAFFLPQVGSHGKAHVAEVATSLHDVHENPDLKSGNILLPLPETPPKLDIVESRLPNGMRVLLTRDPAALAMNARLVIEGTYDRTGADLALDAGLFLEPEFRNPSSEEAKQLLWYSSVAAPVIGFASGSKTTFLTVGITEYADWHVWHLAWTVVHGSYNPLAIDHLRARASDSEARPPSSREVIRRRLAGNAALPDGKSHVPSADELQRFRDESYRPDRATLIVSGNFELAAMQKEIETAFGDWKAGRNAAAAPNAPRVGTAVGIEAPDEATLDFSLAFAPAKPFTAGDVAARAVLVELVNTRVGTIRERMGASYGIHVTANEQAVRIDGAVEPAYATEAFKAISDELARIRSGDPTLADELARAKHHVLAEALTLPASASQRASLLEKSVTDGVDVSHLDAQVQAIRAIDLAAVQKLAATTMQPARMIAAVRGDHHAVAGAFDGLGVAKAKIEWIPAPASDRRDVRPAETPKVAGQDHRGVDATR